MWSLLVPIGAFLAPAQSAAGQDGDSAALLSLRPRSVAALARSVFHQESAPRWADGWALSARTGPAMAAGLQAAYQAESHAMQRLVILVATAQAIAAGPAREAFLAEIAAAESRPVEDRVIALLLAALNEGRHARPEPWRAVHDAQRGGTFVQVGAALAARCAGAAADQPGRRFAGGSVESAAAALLRPLPEGLLAPTIAALADVESRAAAELVARAVLISPATSPGVRRRLADAALAGAGSDALKRAAAAVLPGMLPGADLLAAAADPLVRVVVAQDRTVRRGLIAGGVLGPIPESYLEARLRRHLAAWYAADAAWPELVDAEDWSRDPGVRDAILAMIAYRAVIEPPSAAVAAAVMERARGSAVAAVLAAVLERAAPVEGDPRLQRALALAAANRLPAALLARAIEDWMWRQDLHPGRRRREVWTDLVRDALLAGSNAVAARLQLEHRPPLPRGIVESNDRFFQLADTAFRFVTERAPEPPAELRLH